MKTSPQSIEEVSLEFQRIRAQAKGRPHFPKELWRAAAALNEVHSIKEIALKLGVSTYYLRKRLKSVQPKITMGFAQAQAIPHHHSLVEITIKRNQSPINLRWVGPVKELPTLFVKLFRGEIS